MARRVAIIQARMSSSRLPGKVLMPLLEVPAIAFMIQRVRQARRVDEVVVATSAEPSDDVLASELQQRGISCFRGSLHDVLDRFYSAARAAGAEHVVRLTGDCPLMDADLVDSGLQMLDSGAFDYVSNTDPPSFPDGLDVEAFTFQALERAYREAKLSSEREHVTPFIRNHKELFRCGGWSATANYASLRWTVDHADDLQHVLALLGGLREPTPISFDRFDLYRVIERAPHLAQSAHQRNEGLVKSLQADRLAAGVPT